MIDLERSGCFSHFFMTALCFASQLTHLAEHSDSFSVVVQLDQRLQGSFHRVGIRVVTVVEKLHTVDLFDLQTRLGQRSAG